MSIRKNYTGEQKAKLVLETLKEEKTISQIASENGVHPNQLSKWKNILLERIAEILGDGRRKGDEEITALRKQLDESYIEIGKLTTQMNWIKKNVELNWTRNERIRFIDKDDDMPIITQADLLGINRTSLYYKEREPSKELIIIRNKIDEIYTKWPFLGSRRIKAMLNNENIAISRSAVQNHMRDMGISGICPGPNLSKRNHEHKVYPYLLRNVIASRPNHIFGVDITYVRMKGSWMYLVAYLDWFSRYVVSWEIDQTLEMGFVLEALKAALKVGIPEIVNSDQGSHFTSLKHIAILQENNIKISMDGRGRAMDNIFTERLWRSVKYENIYINEYNSPRELRTGLTKYFHDKNYLIPHQSLGYKIPAEVYFDSNPEPGN